MIRLCRFLREYDKTVLPRKAPRGNRRTVMKDWRSMAHVTWDCKYHVVIVPKYRRKVFYGKQRRRIGEILQELCRQKDVELVEGNAAIDHIHMLLSVPPKYSIAMTLGYLKGKSAIRINRELEKVKGRSSMSLLVLVFGDNYFSHSVEAIRDSTSPGPESLPAPGLAFNYTRFTTRSARSRSPSTTCSLPPAATFSRTSSSRLFLSHADDVTIPRGNKQLSVRGTQTVEHWR